MKKIRLGIINTNYVRIGPYTKKGTEIFDYIYITNLAKRYKKEVKITSFNSGNSLLPVKKESISFRASMEDRNIGESVQSLYEIALVSKAIGMDNQFDIFHVNMGNGEYVLPFAKFTKKPIVVTMHGSTTEASLNKYHTLFKDLNNVHFVSISTMQKNLPIYMKAKTIYHGINMQRFTFDPKGGNQIIWTGRAVPEKGLDEVLSVSKKLKIRAKVFPIIKSEYINWLYTEVLEKRDIINQITNIHIDFNVPRNKLVREYQGSKVFIFPLKWEEPFGFTVIEAMACGTPVVAYAKGSMAELIKDGVTGFLVNPSDDEIKGDFIIKKTGFEGMCEAVKRIYAMPTEEYQAMRLATRKHVEVKFNVDRMVDDYVALYRSILAGKNGAS